MDWATVRRFLIALMAVGIAGAVRAEDKATYLVDGEAKGFFCRFFGFVCTFKRVDALTSGDEKIRPIPRSFPAVSDYKANKDGTARCWITTKSDESRWGWWAVLWDRYTGAPVFYASKSDGGFEKLGSPEFIVFQCRRVAFAP